MKITGTVENIVFRNDENGYSVVNLSCDKKKVTAVGNFPEIFEGQTLELTGEYIVNKKFGEQFKADESYYGYHISGLIQRYEKLSGCIKGE